MIYYAGSDRGMVFKQCMVRGCRCGGEMEYNVWVVTPDQFFNQFFGGHIAS